jgi:hypothetical protein
MSEEGQGKTAQMLKMREREGNKIILPSKDLQELILKKLASFKPIRLCCLFPEPPFCPAAYTSSPQMRTKVYSTSIISPSEEVAFDVYGNVTTRLFIAGELVMNENCVGYTCSHCTQREENKNVFPSKAFKHRF